ncbi:MAG: hypothetical protein IKS19_00010 [Clostridia bacterium]|nr:hypothetical protein [Clostridia bacterium]
MKKIFALLLLIIMAFALVSCAGSGQDDGTAANNGGSSQTETARPAQSSEPEAASEAPAASGSERIIGMSFTPPEEYEKANITVFESTDGKTSNKDITYDFENGCKLTYAFESGLTVDDLLEQTGSDKSKYQSEQFGGETFLIKNKPGTNSAMALTERDGGVYLIQYNLYGIKGGDLENAPREPFDVALQSVAFADPSDEPTVDAEIYDLKYSTEGLAPVVAWKIGVTETKDGDPVYKYIRWDFGTDIEKPEYRFIVRAYRNTTIEEQYSDSKYNEEKEINGITYSVVPTYDENKAPYEYYIQHGSDVYYIKNIEMKDEDGKSVRSEESEKAFEKLLESFSFTK